MNITSLRNDRLGLWLGLDEYSFGFGLNHLDVRFVDIAHQMQLMHLLEHHLEHNIEAPLSLERSWIEMIRHGGRLELQG